ncbi:MAG: rod shape-determining protein RodA [Clostridia bacterium]|nr:rod shape-determining protein RodA [Clostridia bacterium]MBQ5488378.1 rod shape-determining protein RodA [Clostridia bacterium]
MSLFNKESLKRIDWFTLIIVLALVAFGTVALASVMAKPFDGSESGFADYWSKFNVEYLQKHVINFMIGFAAMIIVLLLDYSFIKPFALWIYAAVIGLLALLFVFGKVRGGAQGWFVFDSLERAIQPGELSKIALIITLSKFASTAMDEQGGLRRFKDVMTAAGLTALPFILIVLQPDYGTASVLLVIMIAIFFVARIYWLYVVIAAVLAGVGLPAVYAFVLTKNQRQRIDVFINPDAASDDAKYQVNQSKMAIGSGRLLGKGFFREQTLAQLRYVPARHTDFIFSGITEGVGFVGSAILIVAFFALMLRWLYIAARAKDNFGTCIAVGVVAMFAAHIFENIGMTMGIMPVTGIPLPFISYGGSNMLTNMIGVGLVMNVHMHRNFKKKHKYGDTLD